MYATFSKMRFQTGHDGTTAYSRINGSEYSGTVCKFGEIVMIKGLNVQQKAVWKKGFWLGKSELNDTAFVGTKSGIVTGRTVKRLPGSPKDVKALYELQGTP